MDFLDFLDEYMDSKMIRSQQGMVCKVVEFDKETMRADVQPYLKDDSQVGEDPEDYPTLPSIPVGISFGGGFYIRQVYDVDDLVWVTFATHDIDEPMKENAQPASKKTFDLENASIAYGLIKTGKTTPSEFSDSGLLIGHEDGNAYVRFENNKITMFFGADKVEFDSGGMKAFIAAVGTNFLTHVHGVAGTPPVPGS